MKREQVEAVLSPYYGALTQTAIDDIADKIMCLTVMDICDTAIAQGEKTMKAAFGVRLGSENQ